MRPSPSLGSTASIFTGALHDYGVASLPSPSKASPHLTSAPPKGFNFDWTSGDAPIQDDPRLEGVNVAERVDDFVASCNTLASIYRTVWGGRREAVCHCSC